MASCVCTFRPGLSDYNEPEGHNCVYYLGEGPQHIKKGICNQQYIYYLLKKKIYNRVFYKCSKHA